MLFPAVTHLVEGLSPDTLVALKVKESPICSAGKRKSTAFTIEQEKALFLEILIRIKRQDFTAWNKVFCNVNNLLLIHGYKNIWAHNT
jgi:hypothetical protein